MAGYTITALAVDQKASSKHFSVALCILDTYGSGVQGLRETDLTVQSFTEETNFAVTEMRSTRLPGFYRLSMRAEPTAEAGEYILALVVSHRHVSGRLPGDADLGCTLVKMKVV